MDLDQLNKISFDIFIPETNQLFSAEIALNQRYSHADFPRSVLRLIFNGYAFSWCGRINSLIFIANSFLQNWGENY